MVSGPGCRPGAGAASAATTGVPVAEREPQAVRPLLTVTDEELLAIDGADQGVVAMPYLARIPDSEWELARSTALRGLRARGLLRISTEQPVDVDRDVAPARESGRESGRELAEEARAVDVADDLAWILGARRAPEAILAAQRMAGTPQGPQIALRYVHAVGGRVLIEDVSEDGLHAFAVAPRPALADLMRDYLMAADPGVGQLTDEPADEPADQGADQGADRRADQGADRGMRWSPWPQEVVPRRDGSAVLAGVHLVAEIVVRRDDAPATQAHTAYVYPSVAYVGAAPLHDPAAARLTRLDPRRLGDWAAALLRGDAAPPARESSP